MIIIVDYFEHYRVDFRIEAVKFCDFEYLNLSVKLLFDDNLIKDTLIKEIPFYDIRNRKRE